MSHARRVQPLWSTHTESNHVAPMNSCIHMWDITRTDCREHTKVLQQYEEDKLALEKEVQEKQGDRHLADRKSAAVLKDLKKQLKLEQRKVQRLEEERGGGALAGDGGSDGSNSRGVSRASTIDGSRTQSRASASSLAGSMESLTSIPGGGSTAGGAPIISSDEHTQLLHKMTELQTERAEMSERIRFLEKKTKNLMNEVDDKGELIMQYAAKGFTTPQKSAPEDSGSTSTPGSTPMSRLKGFRKSAGGAKKAPSAAAEANTRMHTVLEETLMKNIQLQRMVEVLQRELAEARGDAVPGTRAASGSGGAGAGVPTTPPSTKASEDTTSM
eukprot:m.768516 g.768516  ORF g.768516 m.768516 type:complete len:329 (+) comp23228_c0_seq2:313-1299(+)